MLLLAVCVERVGGSKNLRSKTCIGGFLNWVSLYYVRVASRRSHGEGWWLQKIGFLILSQSNISLDMH